MSLQGSSTLVTPTSGGRDTAIADVGGYYVGITPVPGTGIVSGASVQAFTETTPYLVLYNGGALNVYPTYAHFHCTVIGATASVSQNWTNTIDNGNRLSSGGTGLTISNTNMTAAQGNGGVVMTVGAITATAATSARRVVGHRTVKYTVIETVNDCVNFNWGAPDNPDPSSLINNAASLSHTTVNWAPVVIGPGQSMVLVRWAGAQTTGTTLEVEFAFVAR